MNSSHSYSLIYVVTFLYVCLFYSPVHAGTAIPIQIIQSENISLEKFKMGYFVDKTETMPLSEIQKQDFRISSNSLSLGTSSKITWAKIELKNINNKPIKLYLHHPYAYHNHKVGLYEVINGKLIRERILDMDNPATLEWMYRGSAVFDIELQNEKTLYIKSISFSHQWFSLNIYDGE